MKVFISKLVIDADGVTHELTFSPATKTPAGEAVIDMACSCGFNADKDLHYTYPSLESIPDDGTIDCAIDAILEHFPVLNRP